MSRTVLVVAAHADDEVLGCGGTIAKHTHQGDCVHLILMADGVSSRDDASSEQLSERNEAAEAAAQILGVNDIAYFGLPDNQMDKLPLLDIVQQLEPLVFEIKPEVVYTHHYGDLNIDHRLTCQAVMTACRPVPGSSVKEIYGFEVMSSTDWGIPVETPFLPTCYVDITDFLDKKLSALSAYKEEMRCYPHSRSIRHVKELAGYRGGGVGVAAAEAFCVYRFIK